MPQGVAEVGECRLGGVDQWVLVRGRELANPPLIHLHGGPGFSETRLLRHFNSDIENRFTVVYRDQRGTGKSFRPSIPRSSMTVEQFLTDLYELVDMVCARVGKEQVVLHGHSWGGSLLGVLYADRHPERIAAYLAPSRSTMRRLRSPPRIPARSPLPNCDATAGSWRRCALSVRPPLSGILCLLRGPGCSASTAKACHFRAISRRINPQAPPLRLQTGRRSSSSALPQCSLNGRAAR